jgi:eukaryotic-like serine/threonine-protein kinase
MSADLQRVKEIFLGAAEKAGADERMAFLQDACGADAALRGQVEALLRRHDHAGSFLESPAQPLAESEGIDEAASPISSSGKGIGAVESPETVGGRIGPYKLLQNLGEGGMGAVWVAEQQEPVKRRVALKVIKPGMDSRQVLRRFEAERQTLALMDHTNIAKVLDAGATAEGRPYFVMELVKGVPITKYCDELHVPVRERLELFAAVCHAIQHAHQKGIIHRDVKPSNVLVAVQDGKPIPKVIDFGVAKALNRELTEQTIYTEIGQVVGTLEYMSPEQAELSALDIDTRADVYGLGVLLYELLTGTTPLDRKRLKQAAYTEMLRIIKDEEPPKPSTRLTKSKDTLADVAARRRTEPAQLTKEVRGDLDWIVMRCLEKDRTRRYESASSLARDIERHLGDEPVEASPPSTGYRLRKFARRNKRALVTAALLGAILMAAVGAVAGTIGWVARDRAARRAKLTDDIQLALQEAQTLGDQARTLVDDDPNQWQVTLAAARSAIKRAAALAEPEHPALDAALQKWLATVKTRLDADEQDRRMLDALEHVLLEAAHFNRDGDVFSHRDRAPAYRQAFQEFQTSAGETDPQQAAAQIAARPPAVAARLVAALDDWRTVEDLSREEREWLAQIVRAADANPWRREMRAAWERRDRPALQKLAKDVDVIQQPPATLQTLARFLASLGAHADQIALLRRGQQHYPGDFWMNQDLAAALWRHGPNLWADAFPYQVAAIAVRPQSSGAHNQLGWLLLEGKGDVDEALTEFRKALELAPDSAQRLGSLAYALKKKGDFKAAIANFDRALGINPKYNWLWYELGFTRAECGDYAGAAEALQQAVKLGIGDAFFRYSLGVAYLAAGQQDAHRRVCADMLKICEKNQDPYWADRTLYTLVPVAASFADAEVLIRLARRASNVQPGNSRILGAVLYRTGNCETAVEQLEAAAKFVRLRAWDHCFLAMAHHRLGNRDKARQCLEAAGKQIDSQSYPWRERTESETLCREAEALLGLDRHELAIAGYRKALATNAKDVNALNSLAWLLAMSPNLKLRDPSQAVLHAQKAVELAPNDGDIWNTLGVARYRAGDCKGAIAALEKSMALLAGRSESANTFYLAMAHWQLGNKEEANRWYDRAVAWTQKNQSSDAELRLYRAEAEELLGLSKKK